MAVLCPCPCPQHSQQLYRHIYLSCKEETNIQKHYEALYGLLALISIELANEEVMVDLIRLVLAVQVGPDVGRTRYKDHGGGGLSSQVQIGILCCGDSCFGVWGHCTLVGHSSMITQTMVKTGKPQK